MKEKAKRASAYERVFVVLDFLKRKTNEENKITISELKDKDVIKNVVKDETALNNLLREYMKLAYFSESSERVTCDNIERLAYAEDDENNIRLGKIYYEHAFSYDEIDYIIEGLKFSKSIDTATADAIIEKVKSNLTDDYYQDDKLGVYNVKEVSLTDKKALRNNFITIQKAIDESACISFFFNGYDSNRTLQRSSEEKYIVTPYYIVAYNSRYYMIASAKKHKTMSIWRVDLMTEVELTDTEQSKENYLFSKEVKDLPRQWDDSFVYSHLNMSVDKPVGIKLKISRSENLKHADYTFMYDWFGDSFSVVRKGEDYDEVHVTCSPFAIVNWALQYSERVEVLEPISVRDVLADKVKKLNEKYLR